MKSWYEQALEVGRRLTREELRRSGMASVLSPRFRRIAAHPTLDEIDRLNETLCAEFPHLRRASDAGAPPTLEQMENLAVAVGLPILPPGLRPPHYETSMRNLHAIVQRAANGDEEAEKTLAALRAAFGK